MNTFIVQFNYYTNLKIANFVEEESVDRKGHHGQDGSGQCTRNEAYGNEK